MSDKPENDTTLVVIDMQPLGFPYARWLIGPVLQQIQRAKALGHGIVLVRYLSSLAGPIAPELINAVAGYDRSRPATKKLPDGSQEILAACATELSTGRFRLCGVTTDECVTKTAHGLARSCPQSRIEVVKAACDCWQGKRFDWSKFSQLANVIPV